MGKKNRGARPAVSAAPSEGSAQTRTAPVQPARVQQQAALPQLDPSNSGNLQQEGKLSEQRGVISKQQGQSGPHQKPQGQPKPQQQGVAWPQPQEQQQWRSGPQQKQQGQPGPQKQGAGWPKPQTQEQQQWRSGPQQKQQGRQPGQQQQCQTGPQQQGQPGPQQQGQPSPQQQGQPGQQQQCQPGPQQQGQPGPQQQGAGWPKPQAQEQQQWQSGPQQKQQGQPGPQQQGHPRPQQQGQPGPQQHGQPRPQQQGTGMLQPKRDGNQSQQQKSGPQQAQRFSRSSSSSSTSSYQPSAGGIPRGTLGRPARVETNYLDINLDKMPDVAYHYDVVITPDRPKKFLRPAFEQFNRKYFPNIQMAYDGKSSFYTAIKLQQSAIEHEVELEDSGSRKICFKIAIKETKDMEIELSSLRSYMNDRIFDKPMRALQCLEVVLANPCHSKGVRAGRSFFMRPEQMYNLMDGYEMWTGLFQAAILGDRPFLNVDIAHKSFPSPCNLIDFIGNNYRANPQQTLERRDIFKLKEFLKMLNIVYEPPKCFGSFSRTYKVNDVSNEPASGLKFKLEDGRTMTIAEYFLSRGYKLRYPNLNCLHVGSTVKKIYLPMELCNIPGGQPINKKDGDNQVKNMIKFAATSTDIRKEKIMRLLAHFQHNVDMKVNQFGIQIGGKFKEIPMRILKSPGLEYYQGEIISPFKGAWRMSERSKFLLTKELQGGHLWAIVYDSKSRVNYHSIEAFAKSVSSLSKKLKMSLAEKPDILAFENIGVILSELKKKKYDLVFVILPRYGTSYAQVKQEAELKLGILTQCIMQNTLENRCNMQTVLNILLKVNGKLNGTNHIISSNTSMPLKNVMFLGADVTHPSPDQKHIPSIVGVAASHDAFGARYNMQYRLQKSSCENIEDMLSIFTHHLKVYFQYQGKYPDHIIYYRDGVSDGQFPIVKNNELRDIRAACSKLRFNPKLTCIVVIKRHHTRFFPQTDRPFDKFNNVEPGTVVDQVIVHPNEVQFFMVSHQSIQGTAKPTRYNVIEDDAKMNIDVLQALTYNLCHMFPRCNRVVSLPVPAYLAHLVAFRGRVYIDGVRNFSEPRSEYQKRLVNVDFMQRNPMYFI